MLLCLFSNSSVFFISCHSLSFTPSAQHNTHTNLVASSAYPMHSSQTASLWARTTKNTDRSTGPLARPFARSLAPLTRSLAPDCSLRSRPPLRSLVRSLAHFAHSLASGTVNFSCLKMTWFCPIVHLLDRSITQLNPESRSTRNPDKSTESFTHPFARSLAHPLSLQLIWTVVY